MNIIFFGSPHLAVPFLNTLVTHEAFRVLAVVTQPDRPKGRHGEAMACPVAEAARAYGIPSIQPVSIRRDAKAVEAVKALHADVFVVVAYGNMIPDELLTLPPFGVVNVHPSLLPKHRGPTPMPATILAGDDVGGISIMKLDHEMDHGPLLAQLELPLSETTDTPALEQLVAYKGPALLVDTLEAYRKGLLKLREQKHELATYCPLLTRDSGRLDWKKDAKELDRMIRAYRPWPGTWTLWKNKRLKILDAVPVSGSFTKAAGTVYTDDDRVLVSCHRGSLELKCVQLENGKPLNIGAFICGQRDFIGSTLEE